MRARNIHRVHRSTVLAVVLATTLPLSLGACANDRSSSSGDKQVRIGFFGWAKVNGVSLATFRGIERYAKAHNATATFVDPNWQASVQTQQIRDAVVSKRFDILVVQANDGAASMSAVQTALSAKIPVVGFFSQLGTDFASPKPQLPGLVNLVAPPKTEGTGMGRLAVQACKTKNRTACRVAFLRGDRTLPLDNARTDAALRYVRAAPGVSVVADPVGGYTQASGRQAVQDVLQAHPDVDVIVGSSQALEGGEALIDTKRVALIGDGGSKQAVAAVRSGRWFGLAGVAITKGGELAAKYGMTKLKGDSVPTATDLFTLTPFRGFATKDNLGAYRADYSD